MKRITLLLLVWIVFPNALPGQEPRLGHGNAEVAAISELSRQGRFRELIDAAKPLLAAQTLSPLDEGKAWTYMAHAYQQEGDFKDAVPAYENALKAAGRSGEKNDEYATALSAFSGLYLDMGQPDIAQHMELRTLKIYEGMHDHTGMAMTWSNLAAIAASRNQEREGRKFVEHAMHEAGLGGNLPEDYFASLASTQGRITELEGDPAGAIPQYQRALALWKHAHGEWHPEVGWLDVLLAKAYLEAGNIDQANTKTREGLNLLAASFGPENNKYLLAEVVYARVLDARNEHAQAVAVREEANAKLNATSRECLQCRISVAALR